MQFHALPIEWRAGCGSGCEQHPAETRQRAGDGVDGEAHAREVDAGEASGGRIATERIDRPAKVRVLHDDVPQHGDHDQDHEDDGDADEGVALEEPAGAEPGEVRLGANPYRIAVGRDEEGDAAERREGTQCRDDRVDAQERDDRAVHEARDQAGDQARDERVLHPAPGGVHGKCRHHAGNAGNGSNRNIECPRDDDDGFADGQHAKHSNVLSERVQQVTLPKKEWRLRHDHGDLDRQNDQQGKIFRADEADDRAEPRGNGRQAGHTGSSDASRFWVSTL